MKFELKTENENNLKLFSDVFRNIFILSLIIIFCHFVFKFGIITRHYQVDYYCKLLSFSKSSSNFKKLSRLSNLKSKQKIWDFCKEFIK